MLSMLFGSGNRSEFQESLKRNSLSTARIIVLEDLIDLLSLYKLTQFQFSLLSPVSLEVSRAAL